MASFDDALQLAPSLSVVTRRTGIAAYDFDFRRYLPVSSVWDFRRAGPVVLRVGPIDDYRTLTAELVEAGARLLLSPEQHVRVSHLPAWYPLLEGLTPRSVVYETVPSSAEVGGTLGWPVFIKGSRQTNRHKASTSVARSPADFERIRQAWRHDDILHWQQMVCREWLRLAPVGEPVGDVVQPSMEVRTVYFRGELAAAGAYWSDHPWRPTPAQLDGALEVAKEAVRRLDVPLVAVDLAVDVEGRWWVVECNDAQECGVAGMSPLVMWQTIQSIAAGSA